MKYIYNVLFVFYWTMVTAQVTQTTYGSTEDDEFSSIVEVENGNYMLVGTSKSINGLGGKDIYVLKLSSDYKVIWSKTYGGIYDDIGYTINLKSNGNVLIGGSSSSFNLGSNLDVLFFELNILGEVVWSKIFSSAGYDKTLRRVNISNNGYVACVMSNAIGSLTHSEMIAFEFSENADTVFWQNKIQSITHEGDIPSSIIQSKAGNFIMVGATNTTPTKYDPVVMRLSETGTLISHFAFGSIGNENCQDVLELDNGDLLLEANFRVLVGSGLEMALIKINEIDNSFKWIKTYGDAGIHDDRPYSFKKISDDTIIMAAFTYSYNIGSQDLAFIRINGSGDLIDISVFGGTGEEQPFDMICNSNSDVLIVGYSTSWGNGSKDAYLVKVGSEENQNCFVKTAIESEINLSTHLFNYVEQDPELSLTSVSLSSIILSLDTLSEYESLVVNGKLSFVNNEISDLGLNTILNTVHLNGNIQTVSDLTVRDTSFSLTLPTSDRLYFDASLVDIPSTLMMRHVNGFDAYQMENVIANKINAPLQMQLTPFALIAADLDLSDKVRSNDVSMLQERIVKKIFEYDQQLPVDVNKSAVDWRFVEQSRVDRERDFQPSEYFPMYSPKGYCRDNVPDIPFFLDNQGSCDGSFQETYHAILLGDMTEESPGIDWDNFTTQQSKVTFEIDNLNDLGNDTYRVFYKYTLAEQDQLHSIDFVMDYNEDSLRFQQMDVTVEDPHTSPQWMYNDFEEQELLFTSYTMAGYPLTGNLMYFDFQKIGGTLNPDDLGAIHVFLNGKEVPSLVVLKNQTSTGIEQTQSIDDFVQLYPNPADQGITINIPKRFREHTEMVLINNLGQTVKNSTCTEEEKWYIDLQDVASGLYQCVISISGKQPVVKKLIVR